MNLNTKEGSSNVTVTGNELPDNNGKDKILEGLNNIRIVKQKKNCYITQPLKELLILSVTMVSA